MLDSPELVLVSEEPGLPRDQRIRNLFEKSGPLSTRALAALCIAEGIFTEADQANAHLQAFQKVVRAALSATDEFGLPRAGRSTECDEDGAPVWKQRRFWIFEDYAANISELIKKRNTEHTQAVRLIAECENRFKKSIELVRLPDESGIWTNS